MFAGRWHRHLVGGDQSSRSRSMPPRRREVAPRTVVPVAHDTEGRLTRAAAQQIVPQHLDVAEPLQRPHSRYERPTEHEVGTKRLDLTDKVGEVWGVRVGDSPDLPGRVVAQESVPRSTRSMRRVATVGASGRAPSVPRVAAAAVTSESALSCSRATATFGGRQSSHVVFMCRRRCSCGSIHHRRAAGA